MKNYTITLMDKLFRAETLLHRYQSSSSRSHEPYGNPQRGQGRVLSLLKIQPQISQKELSYLLDMRQQSLSELLAKLERRGFIKRTPSEDDRRVTMITLTDEGMKAASDAQGNEIQGSSAFDCLLEDEQRIMGEYLDRLIDSLEKELKAAEQSDDSDPSYGRHTHGDCRRCGEHNHHGRHGRHGGHGPMPHENPHHWNPTEHASDCQGKDCGHPSIHSDPAAKGDTQAEASSDAQTDRCECEDNER